MEVTITELNRENFCETSLDGFERYQKVDSCWRKLGKEYVLTPVSYVENWSKNELRRIARMLLDECERGAKAFLAVNGGEVIGFALLDTAMFGASCIYATLAELYVSAPFRNKGVGKKLFLRASKEALSLGADKLYISAHSAEDTISAYRNWGCVFADEINYALAEKEPFDLQLEFDLRSL